MNNVLVKVIFAVMEQLKWHRKNISEASMGFKLMTSTILVKDL